MIARLQMQPGDFFVHIIILTLECRDGQARPVQQKIRSGSF